MLLLGMLRHLVFACENLMAAVLEARKIVRDTVNRFQVSPKITTFPEWLLVGATWPAAD